MMSSIPSLYRQLFAWSGCQLRTLDNGEETEASVTSQELSRGGHVMLCCDGPALAERDQIQQVFSLEQVSSGNCSYKGFGVKMIKFL